MKTQDALNCLNELLCKLWNSGERHTNVDVEELIQALEEVAIPLIERRIKEEEIADKFNELGLPGPILTKEMLEYVFDIKKENKK